MNRILTKDIALHLGKVIEIAGWIHRERDLGGVAFVILRDRSGFCQVVFSSPPQDKEGRAITLESVVCITGRVTLSEKAPTGHEIQATGVTLISRAEPNLPISVNEDPKKLGIEAMLDNRMVSLRNPKTLSIFRFQAYILKFFTEFLRKEDFTEIKSSKLIGTGTEGGTGLFEVKYFDQTVYLTQSPQLYKQAMVASGLERVFEVGMAYRAEKHDTPRHINEYVSLDIEMAFIENEHDLMDFEQKLLEYVFTGLDECARDIIDQWDASLLTKQEVRNIPRLNFQEAKDVLKQYTNSRIYEITPEGERYLCDWAKKNHNTPAVFVYGDPRRKRPFYTYPAADNKTMSFDLLFRGLEITTGGRRINSYSMLLESLGQFGLSEDSLKDYLSVFKYGCPPHGGFAIGLERLTQKILGLNNVKEAVLFPRDRKRINP